MCTFMERKTNSTGILHRNEQMYIHFCGVHVDKITIKSGRCRRYTFQCKEDWTQVDVEVLR